LASPDNGQDFMKRSCGGLHLTDLESYLGSCFFKTELRGISPKCADILEKCLLNQSFAWAHCFDNMAAAGTKKLSKDNKRGK